MRLTNRERAPAAAKQTGAPFLTSQTQTTSFNKTSTAGSAPKGALASATRVLRSAYHEAGHAVAYAVHRISFAIVTVNSDGRGFCDREHHGRSANVDFEDHAVCSLAGAYAEARMCGRGLTQQIIDCARDDFEIVDRDAGELVKRGFSETVYGANLILEKRTREFINEFWDLIILVAAALLDARSLTSADVSRIVGGAS